VTGRTMSIDATSAAGGSSTPGGSPGAPLPLDLIQMLAKGGGGSGSLRQLLSMAQLSVEQHTLVELFLSLDQSGNDPAEDEQDEHTHGERDDGEAAAEEPRRYAYERPPVNDTDSRDGRSLRELMQELADLREVNDTVAAALGACGACWGGDPACPACGGHGRAGFAAPHPALFKELVVPAVRRARTPGREGDRTGFSRAGSDSPRQQQRRQFDER